MSPQRGAHLAQGLEEVADAALEGFGGGGDSGALVGLVVGVEGVEGQDLAGMIGLKRVLRENDLTLTPIRQRQARVVEPPGADPADELGRIVTEIPDSPLPRALIFRDSFTSKLAPFLSEHFSRAVYLWQNDFDASAVDRERPDVVVQEIAGRHLYTFIPSPELVPK